MVVGGSAARVDHVHDNVMEALLLDVAVKKAAKLIH